MFNLMSNFSGSHQFGQVPFLFIYMWNYNYTPFVLNEDASRPYRDQIKITNLDKRKILLYQKIIR